MHPVAAQRIHRHHGGDPGIDAARKTQNNTGEIVLVHIVAQAEHHRLIDALLALDPVIDPGFDAGPAVIPAYPFGHGQMLDELLRSRDQTAVGIQREGTTIEDQLILPADLVHIDQRQFSFGHTCHRMVHAHIDLVSLIGAAIDDDQNFRTGLHQRLGHIRRPHVFTNGEAEAHAPEVHGARKFACIKYTLFIEHTVIRQVPLESERLDLSAIEHRRRIEAPPMLVQPWRADDHARAAIDGFRRQFLDRFHRRTNKGVLEDQVLGRIAGHAQFGPDNQIGALPRGPQTRGTDFREIAVNIPDNGVQLGERNLQGIGHETGRYK